jgi:hypothetical protein
MKAKIKVNKIFDENKVPVNSDTCIYSLISDGVCVYVGQTVDIKSRLYQHLLDGKVFDSFEYELCKRKDADISELNEIIKRQPTLNKVLPPNNQYISMTTLSSQITEMLLDNADVIDFVFCGAKHENARKTKRYLSHDTVSLIKELIINSISKQKEITK